jgi:hypothetical protein
MLQLTERSHSPLCYSCTQQAGLGYGGLAVDNVLGREPGAESEPIGGPSFPAAAQRKRRYAVTTTDSMHTDSKHVRTEQ